MGNATPRRAPTARWVRGTRCPRQHPFLGASGAGWLEHLNDVPGRILDQYLGATRAGLQPRPRNARALKEHSSALGHQGEALSHRNVIYMVGSRGSVESSCSAGRSAGSDDGSYRNGWSVPPLISRVSYLSGRMC